MTGLPENTRPTDSEATRPAVLYLRYSPKPELKKCDETIESQRDACQRYCATRGLHVVATLEDPLTSARSTKLRDRKEGGRLSELIDGGVRDVVVVRLDRIFRDTVDGLETMNAWNAQGVSLHLADQGGCSINCGTATGTMIATMLLAYASFEPALTSERTKSSMLYRQKNGQRMTGRKSIPWGWMLDPQDETRMAPCEWERSLTKTLRMFADTDSLSDLAKRLNDNDWFDYGPCRGKPWDHGKVRRAMNAAWDDETPASD